MSINIKDEALRASNGGNVQTEQEFEDVLAIFKAKFPEKYAVRLASGDFDRQRSKLFGKVDIDVQRSAEKVAQIAEKASQLRIAEAKEVLAKEGVLEKPEEPEKSEEKACDCKTAKHKKACPLAK